MYNDHFHFNRDPFSIAPDPRFLYLSDVHNEAFAHLTYGFANSGFVLITGEVGTGKTTLLRNLIGQTPTDLDVAFILNPRLTVKELLETICEELGINQPDPGPQSVKEFIDLLNKHLLRSHSEGRSTVIIIDEAQNLTPAVLEQIRLLTNLETNERKLLRIILLGQPELGTLLEREELRQLAQRITARYHLTSLDRADCAAYVAHRLTRAGGNPNIFEKSAVRKLYRISKGIPRVINVLADRALLGAYVEGTHTVSASVVKRAAREVFGNQRRYPWWLAASVVSVSSVSMAWAYFSTTTAPETQFAQVSSQTFPASTSEKPKQDELVALEPSVRVEQLETITPAEIPVNEQIPDNLPSEITEPARTVAESPRAPAQKQSFEQSALISKNLPELPAAIRIGRPPEGGYRTQRMAYEAVFALWGARYVPEENSIPCDFAPTVGLQCLRLQGSWSEINQLNLPVVLELWDAQAVRYFAAVTATEPDGGTFQFNLGEDVYRITPNDLRDIWFGAYVVLWKMPPDYHGSLRNGDEHPSVGWLRGQLTSLTDSQLASPTPNFFDETLREAVIKFQRSEGLLADGVVGPATWIRLTDRLQVPTPKLHT